MKPFIRTSGLDRQVQIFEDSTATVFDSIYKNPLLGNLNIIQNVSLSTSDTYVNHKLGKAVTGYIVVNSNAAAQVYTSSTTNTQPTTAIILKASTSVIVSILFF